MMENGLYKLRFWTSQDVGTGVIILSDGILHGGDSMAAYSGHYTLDRDTFLCTFRLARHSEGMRFMKGPDRSNVQLAGKFANNRARLVGKVLEVPNVELRADLEKLDF